VENCKDWQFLYTKSGWNNRQLSITWLKPFDTITKARLTSSREYRLLILDGCEIHIHIEFIEYCLDYRIAYYCLPPHSTHLLQPLDVGLFSPLQKYYGKEVDMLVRYGSVAVNKGNFLPLLVKARTQTYTKENVMSAWCCSVLIPPNSRTVLHKLSKYREKPQQQLPPPPVPATPRKSKALLHNARQAKLLLKPTTTRTTSLSSQKQAELAGLIDSLERFAIATDRDLQLGRDTNKKWRETQKLSPPIDRRELKAQNMGGKVMDGCTLKFIYEERQRIDSKKAGREGKPAKPKFQKSKEVQFEDPDEELTLEYISILTSDATDSRNELVDWEDDFNIDLDDSSMGSFLLSLPHYHVS